MRAHRARAATGQGLDRTEENREWESSQTRLPRPQPVRASNELVQPVGARDRRPHHHRPGHRGALPAPGVAAWQVWNEALHWRDLAILAVVYVLTGLGITVGFHRLLTHRSFKTSRGAAGILAALGSAAIEGPVISWVADHRKHHAFSDEQGDPHSPHVGHGGGWRGTLRGLFHAHMGWLFIHTERGSKRALRAGSDG